MNSWQLKTPVVLIIFNRPDTTEKVFEVIRQVKPPKLFVIADGSRVDRSDEAEKCAAARAIIDRVDWDCQVFKNYSNVNMGCKRRVSSGLDWVFNTIEEAVILEDDCLPHPTFFRFCEELLEKYRDDERVMTITGTNLLGEWKTNIQSYHFSYYFNCWGWATWKRVWQCYDVDMKLWSEPEVKKRIGDVIADKKQYFNRKRLLDAAYLGNNNSWAYQFFFMCLLYSGMSITPAKNLISNIGFSKEGTNTKVSNDQRANMPLQSMNFPLKDPLGIAVDREHDYRRYKKVWEKSLSKSILRKTKRLLVNSKSM
ncbi:MAG: glycosyltransferase family 2 protein [Symploca sp. SIO3C6]|uniref:Glycosyltransferase family 2 protein n=1 Tax=Symploca sp. SIO1C4 TaxID=2607765 RepID=A0A6B3N5B2_9CYAN|nr:glycosyltransferase family 2 protein [Symploca sp. SIO3C6]NER26740.1 glycosyltransferase family 2 protein [Symploca sp. SIO1C4]